MLTNYLKIAFRNMLRNWGYSITNIAGLAIGITSCILIMLFVKSEFSYDHFHTKSDRIYRAWLQEIYEGQTFTNTQTPIPLGPTLQANIPDVESNCRVYAFNTLVQYGGNKFNESVTMVDSDFFQIFDFKIIEGDQSVLLNKNALILTEPMAKKYFGTEKAIGKNLELQLGTDKILFTVSAIAEKSPQESNIKFDMLIPHSNDVHLFSERQRTRGWTSVFEETYVLLHPGRTGKDAEAKIPDMAKKIAGDNYKPGEYNIHFQAITDIHLNKTLPAGNQPTSDPAYSYILGTIGLLILLIACINFVTLSVGRSTTRAMEVGVRKALGAGRASLIRQFWGEAILLTLFSLCIGIGLAYLLLHPFNGIANRDLTLNLSGFNLSFILLMVIVIGLIAGIYPALVLSSFNPIQALKNKVASALNIGLLRKGLIIGQFTASIIMIIGTIVVGQQLYFLQNKNMGYNKERIVIVSTNKPRKEGMPLAERFKSELLKNPQVIGSTVSLFSFSEPGWANVGYEDEKKVYRNFRMNSVDADFANTMKLELLSGRNFSSADASDMINGMIVNETLVKEYGWNDPIGKKLDNRYDQTIIGVVKDFHFESLHNPIAPLALVMRPDSIFRKSDDIGFAYAPQPRINIRLKEGNLLDQIATIEKDWKSTAGNQDFDYKFLDASLDAQYKDEKRLGSIVRYASLLSLFISCLGLFGLATLSVVQRMKEIGIRKVLGANIPSILILISKDFVWLILMATALAIPLSLWALNKWLQGFVFRIHVQWWVFFLSGIICLIISIMTISVQAIRAALTNPVKSLRTE
ncbi:MAG: ABC transporter permease [Saprospiraceae bacterium]